MLAALAPRGVGRLAVPSVAAARSSSHKAHAAPVKREKDPEEFRKDLPPAVAEQLQAFPSIIRMPLIWGHQDLYAHLNNVSYARYMEQSRIAYLHQLIRPHVSPEMWSDFINAKGRGIIASNLAINFKRPLEYPCYISVGTRIPLETIKNDRFEMHYALISDEDGALASDGHCGIVSYDYRIGKKCAIPDEIRAAIENAERPFAGKPLPSNRRKHA